MLFRFRKYNFCSKCKCFIYERFFWTGETNQTQAANFASLSAILYYTDSLAAGASATDAIRILFGSQFSNLVDANDGLKFSNLDETMAIKQGSS